MKEIRCSVCGSVVNPGDSFCQNCGSPVEVPTQAQTETPVEPEAAVETAVPVQEETQRVQEEPAAQETTVLSGNPFSVQNDEQPMPADAGNVYQSAPAGSVGMGNTYQPMPGSGAETSYQGNYSAYDATADATADTGKKPGKGLGIAALILAIIGLVTSCCFGGFLFGLIGLILGIVCLAKKGSKGLGISSIIISAVSLLISLIMAIMMLATGGSIMKDIRDYVPDEYQDAYDDMTGNDDYDYDDDDYSSSTLNSTNQIMVNYDLYTLPASLDDLGLTVCDNNSEDVSDIETYGMEPGDYKFVVLDSADGYYNVWGYIENTGSDTVYSVDDLQVTGINADNYSNDGVYSVEVYGGVTLGMSRSDVESAIGTPSTTDSDGLACYESESGSEVLRVEYDDNDDVCALDVTIYVD